MGWEITYNDFGSQPSDVGSAGADWTHIHIDSYDVVAVLETDGVSIKTNRHTIVGTALVTADNAADLKTQWLDAEAKLSKQRGALVISNGTGNDIANLDEWVSTGDPQYGGDETEGGPRCDFTVNEIHGAKTIIVAFSITWHERTVIATDTGDYHVMSHVWSQKFNVDQVGLQTHTVEGRLSVSPRVANSEAYQRMRLGRNPDRYRNLAVPALPRGFIWESREFATDQEGTTLIYRTVARQIIRNIPHPATKGTGSVRLTQSIDLLIRKSFRGTLEGNSRTSPAQLLDELTRMSQNVIRFIGEGSDEIIHIEAAIEDVFDRNVVSLSVNAIGHNPEKQALSNKFGTSIFNNLTNGDVPYQEPDAHGDAFIRSVKRLFYEADRATANEYTDVTFPRAKTEESDVAGFVASYQVPVLPSTAGGAGDDEGTETPSKDHKKHVYLDITGTERVEDVPNVLPLPSLTSSGKTKAFQVAKPRVLLVTEYTITRKDKAPDRLFLKRPAGSILIKETFTTSTGHIDGAKNRVFTGHYKRILDITDQGQENAWRDEQGTIGGDTITFRRWAPPNNLLAFPLDARSEDAGTNPPSRSIFDPMEDERFVMKINLDPVIA